MLRSMTLTAGTSPTSDPAGHARGISDERLNEIRRRLNQRPPVVAVVSDPDKSPVASYLGAMRQDQRDLLDEVDRLKAQVEAFRIGGSTARPAYDMATPSSNDGWAKTSTRRGVSPIW